MFKEFTENTISKAKEDVVISQGLLVLIAAVSFITGLIVGILCVSGANASKKRKIKKNSQYEEDYPGQVAFDSFDPDDFNDGDDGSYEYAL